MKRVLFLDIDGVLTSYRSIAAFGGRSGSLEGLHAKCDPIALQLVRRLCKSAGASVVISSAWRTSYDWSEIARVLQLPAIGATPVGLKSRGHEIQAWLDRVPADAYAIADDMNDMLPSQLSHFVHIRSMDGITWADYVKLCNLLDVCAFDGCAPAAHMQAPDGLDWS